MEALTGKRLIIFGCGYVGLAVARAAIQAGARVETLTRNPEKAAALRALGVTKSIVAELSSTEWHARLEPGADFVINCVSSGGGTDGYQRSYVDGMRSILQWAGQGGAPTGTFAYTSSTSVYPQSGGQTVEETAPAEGATPNGRIIRESELLLQNAPASTCARALVFRLAGIYGPDRHHLLDQLRGGALTLGGSGTHHLNLIHRDDIVAALLAGLTAPADVKNEIFNVADGQPALRADVVQWLSEQLNRPVPLFDGAAGTRRGGEPMPDRVISSAKIQRVLGWRPEFPDYRTGFLQILADLPA